MQDIIRFEDSQIRSIESGPETMFVLRVVLAAMDSTTRPADAKTLLEQELGDGVVTDYPIRDELGRRQVATLVSRPGLTYLVASSRTEAGRRLNKFIHRELLPSIEEKGHYAHKGSRLDTMMQRRTIGYRSLWSAYGTDRPPMSDLTQRVMRGFNKMAKDAGLPDQVEAVKPDPEIYMMTPALARNLIESYYGGKDNGGRRAARALKWLEAQITNQ